jgi:hypothetical protein
MDDLLRSYFDQLWTSDTKLLGLGGNAVSLTADKSPSHAGNRKINHPNGACTFPYTLDVPAFPVDTHIHRVTRRLGWIPEKASAEKAHEICGAAIPTKLHYRLHLNLIELRRRICHAQRPEHEACPLRDLCDFYRVISNSALR